MLCSNYVSDKTFVLLKEINLRNSKFVVISNFYFDTGPAPRGGIPGAVPPQTKIPPPKQGLFSEEINRIEATGVQIEAQIGVCHWYFRYRILEYWHRISWQLWDEDLFLFGDHLFSAGKTAWISDFGRKIPLNFSEDLFFLEITCFWPEKPFKFLISAKKSIWIFDLHNVHLI